MSNYIEVTLTLDSLDLIQIENLISIRVKELNGFKKESTGWLHKQLADEQLANYRLTMKKIKAAREEVKRTKQVADEAFSATLKARSNRTRAPKRV